MAAEISSPSPPALSALIVNYNGGDLLTRSVTQLREAAGALDIEILVADNGSTDHSLDGLRGQPKLRILELGENLGFGVANNRAAAEARSDRLLLLNSDAWPRPGCLEALMRRFDRDPKLALVAPRLVYEDGRPQFHWAPTTSILGEALQTLRNRFESFDLTHRLTRGLMGQGWYTAACVLVRKEAFDAIGGFDEDFFLYFEDVDICLRLRAAGWRLAEEPEVTAVHVKGGSQSPSSTAHRDDSPEGTGTGSQSPGELFYRQGQLRYYARHRPAWENALIRRKLRRKFLRRQEPQRSQLMALLEAP